jgi:hypothetical protein
VVLRANVGGEVASAHHQLRLSLHWCICSQERSENREVPG